jgi:hypothetical protein
MRPFSRPIAVVRHLCHPNSMTVHGKAELERLNRAARREFSHALMSDTKWRKLFAVLNVEGLGICQMLVKFIDVPEPRTMDLPRIGALNVPRPYIDTIEFGPVEFRSIEWLEIPAIARIPRFNNVPAREVAQDLGRIEAGLALSGLYPLRRSGENLRIIGYDR